MAKSPVSIAPARFPDDLEVVRALFREYVDSLGVDLSFQEVEAELAELPGKYVPSRGAILLAWNEAGHPVGCVALRPFRDAGACEMKRLYLGPQARGRALGRRLAEAIIACARQAEYDRMLLDTLASMEAAQGLYASLGFRATAPYYDNPLPGARFMALDLKSRPDSA